MRYDPVACIQMLVSMCGGCPTRGQPGAELTLRLTLNPQNPGVYGIGCLPQNLIVLLQQRVP